jgi:hypothetical protein
MFFLTFSSPAPQPYALESLSPMQQDLLRRLQHVGLVSFDVICKKEKKKKKKKKTPLVVSLCNFFFSLSSSDARLCSTRRRLRLR